MRLIVDVHHVLDGELGVALRGGQALVAEEFLDGAQVGSLFQHVRAEGVAQGVWMHIRRQPTGERNALDDAVTFFRIFCGIVRSLGLMKCGLRTSRIFRCLKGSCTWWRSSTGIVDT